METSNVDVHCKYNRNSITIWLFTTLWSWLSLKLLTVGSFFLRVHVLISAINPFCIKSREYKIAIAEHWSYYFLVYICSKNKAIFLNLRIYIFLTVNSEYIVCYLRHHFYMTTNIILYENHHFIIKINHIVTDNTILILDIIV